MEVVVVVVDVEELMDEAYSEENHGVHEEATKKNVVAFGDAMQNGEEIHSITVDDGNVDEGLKV